MKMKWKGLLTLSLGFALLSACEQGTISKEQSSQIINDVQAAKSIEIAEKGEMQSADIYIESAIGDYESYQYALHYPSLLSDVWNEEMDKWVKGKIQQFESEVEELMQVEQVFPYELHIDFEIYDLNEHFISVKFNESKFLGGAHTEEQTFTYNFNRDQERFVELDDLFKDHVPYLQQLSELSYEKLMEVPDIQELVWDESFQSGINPDKENFSSFALNKGKLLIFFQRYQVGPNSIGSPMIEIDETELKTILKTNKLSDHEQIKFEETETNIADSKPEEDYDLDPNKKHIAITLDDGPHQTVTKDVLDSLAKHDARATFFVLGNRVEFHSELIKRMQEEGHEIANHSWSHPQLTNLSEEEVKTQIEKTSNEIEKITGEKVELVRPPYGAVNEMTKQYIDYPLIFWSIDPEDWRYRDADVVFNKVTNEVYDGAIILLHDIYPTTAEALDRLLDWLYENNYEVVTVSELLNFTDETMEAGKIYTEKNKD